MFRASLCPSSGEQDRVVLHMVFCTGCAGCGCVELGRKLCVLCKVYCSYSTQYTQLTTQLTWWDKSLIIKIGLVASCWFTSLYPTFHDARSQEPKKLANRNPSHRVSHRNITTESLISRSLAVRTALFWAITQRIVVIPYRRFETTYRSHLQGSKNQDYCPMKMGIMGCPETSVMNYHYTLRNSPEERSYHLIRGGRMQSNSKFLLQFQLSFLLRTRSGINSWRMRTARVTKLHCLREQ